MQSEADEANGNGNGNNFDEELREANSPLDHDKASRFYDRIRARIDKSLAMRGGATEKVKEFLLFVPDIFILLWRLANDSRVNGKNKILLGSGLAYYILPLEFLPEAILGPVGYLDDLVFGVYILNRMLADTDESILREHWSGSTDLLETIRRVLDTADNLVATDFVKQIKRFVK